MSPREGLAAFLLRLRGKGISTPELAAAFEATPRTQFVPGAWRDAAWSERMLPIDCGEAMEGADLQALAIRHLALEPGHRVLEIGTGSGYTAAVMARLAARIVTVERYRTLADQARQRHESLGLGNVVVRHTDGSGGLPAEGPFDRIVVWAAFDTAPRSFVDQIAINGLMLAAIGPGDGEQVLAKLAKVGSRFEREDIAHVRLQPIAAGVAARI